MRQCFALLIILLSIHSSFAQECIAPIDKNTFQEGFNQVAVQSTSAKKLSLAILFIKNKCLSATQVKTMAQLFSEDVSRLDFCKAAYTRTTDKGNFYEAYDAFENFSYAFRLHDFVLASAKPVVTVPPTPTDPTLTFPNYLYPSSLGYKGVKGCAAPVVSVEQFMKIVNNTSIQPTEESKQLAITNAAESACLDFAQAMKVITLLTSEEIRLKTLTKIFPRIYDLESYKSGTVLFTNKNLQSEWIAFGNYYLTPPAAACTESDADFEKDFKLVHDKFFDHERIKIIETFSTDHCFSVAQIKRLVSEITPASRNVDIFKKLYDKCSDKKSYASLTNELFFASEKEALMTFLRSKEK